MKPFKLRERLESFRYALRGVRVLIGSQHNAWIHALATIAVVAAGLSLRLSRDAWCWVVLAIMAAWTAEALNTAVEFLAGAARESILAKFIRERIDLSRSEGATLAS